MGTEFTIVSPLSRAAMSSIATNNKVLLELRENKKLMKRIVRLLEEREGDASLSVDDFCRKEGFSHDTFYELLKDGRGPVIIRIGDPVKGQIRITAQARWDWQRARETETRASQAAQADGRSD
jgi:hypothetical protein